MLYPAMPTAFGGLKRLRCIWAMTLICFGKRGWAKRRNRIADRPAVALGSTIARATSSAAARGFRTFLPEVTSSELRVASTARGHSRTETLEQRFSHP
jgi:hypothetical protein